MNTQKKLLLLSSIFFILSCKSENKEVLKLEERIQELNIKLDKVEQKINDLPSNNTISIKQGFLNFNTKVKGESYWDITTTPNTVGFAYHRKNQSEMWQPLPNAYSWSYNSGYVRIGNNDDYDLEGEEYLIVSIKLNK